MTGLSNEEFTRLRKGYVPLTNEEKVMRVRIFKNGRGQVRYQPCLQNGKAIFGNWFEHWVDYPDSPSLINDRFSGRIPPLLFKSKRRARKFVEGIERKISLQDTSFYYEP